MSQCCLGQERQLVALPRPGDASSFGPLTGVMRCSPLGNNSLRAPFYSTARVQYPTGLQRPAPFKHDRRRESFSLGVRASADGSAEAGKATGLTYRESGVDIDAGAELVRRIAKMTPGIGGFGGLYPFGESHGC